MTSRLSLVLSVALCQLSIANEPVSFRSQVAPILLEHCLACHGPKKAEGGYRVDTFEQLTKPGDSEISPVDSKAVEASELLRRLTADESERMPAESQPLASDQIELIQEWIGQGAEFDGDDASQTLAFVVPPAEYAIPPEAYEHTEPIVALAFSQEGSQLIVGGYHELTIWDVASGELARRIPNLGRQIFDVEFDPEQQMVAVACGEPGKSGEVRLVDFQTGTVRAVLVRAEDVVLDLAFHPDGSKLAVAAADNLVRIVDVETGSIERTIASHADWVTAVAWSDDGTHLASASRDKTAKVHAADSGDLLISYQGHAAAVRGVAFLADGKELVSSDSVGHVHRWKLEDAKRVADINVGGELFRLARQADFMLVPSSNKQLHRIDLAKNSIAQAYQGHLDWVLSSAVHPSDGRLAAGGFDSEVRIWNTADGELIKAFVARP